MGVGTSKGRMGDAPVKGRIFTKAHLIAWRVRGWNVMSWGFLYTKLIASIRPSVYLKAQ